MADQQSQQATKPAASTSPGLTEQEAEQIKQQTLDFCQQRDAIMEPQLFEHISRYVRTRSGPGPLIAALADGYSGIAQAANVMRQWLTLSGMTESEVDEMTRRHVRTWLSQQFNAEQVEQTIREKHKATGSISFLQTIVSALIQEQDWRQLVHQLAASNDRSFFLEFSVKAIVDAGFYAEMLDLSIVQEDVEIFTSALSQIIAACFSDQESMARAGMDDLVNMALQSQQSYTVILSLLHEIKHRGDHSDQAAAIERLISHVESRALARGHEVLSIRIMLDQVNVPSEVVSAISGIIRQRATTAADLAKLCQFYQRDAESKPPLSLLQTGELIDTLFKEAFSPAKAIDDDTKDSFAFLLATISNSGTDGAEVTKEQFEEAQSALRRTLGAISERNMQSSAWSTIFETVAYPVVARGLLYWLDVVLDDKMLFATINPSVVPPYLSLVDQITLQHAALHSKVLSLVSSLFRRSYDVESLVWISLQKMFVDRIILVMMQGTVAPVLRWISEDGASLDSSLVAHFVTETMFYMAGPYSTDLAMTYTRLLSRNSVLSVIRRKKSLMSALQSFVKELSKAPGLPAEFKPCLTEIYKGRAPTAPPPSK